MKFAFLIMGNFNSKIDHASIHNGMAQMIGVANIQEASIVAKKLYEDGIDCIELCGAFSLKVPTYASMTLKWGNFLDNIKTFLFI